MPNLPASPGRSRPPKHAINWTAWSLIALRDIADGGNEIHALGWRTGLLNTWITSPLVVVNRAANVVSTTSGHAYSLGRPDARELHPALRGHLAYALRTWGYDNVQE